VNFPIRKLPRLSKYNYSSGGYYFITICTHNKSNLFYYADNLNKMGKIAKAELENIPLRFEDVSVDKYVVMPNHIHCIMVIECGAKAERSRPFPTLSTVIGLYKSGVSRQIHKLHPTIKVWQKSFHDHIIRNEEDYLSIWQYIDDNPTKWDDDEYFIKT
jgi:Transposase and inactivated derivatives